MSEFHGITGWGTEYGKTVTITIPQSDAVYMAEDEWVDDRLRRIADACQAALELMDGRAGARSTDQEAQ